MNHYEIWCNLKNSAHDLKFTSAATAMLSSLRDRGEIADFRIMRRKLGLAPTELGEFKITISTEDLAQLDRAFDLVARRSGEVEGLHGSVYSLVTDLRAGLYRDFPGDEREE